MWKPQKKELKTKGTRATRKSSRRRKQVSHKNEMGCDFCPLLQVGDSVMGTFGWLLGLMMISDPRNPSHFRKKEKYVFKYLSFPWSAPRPLSHFHCHLRQSLRFGFIIIFPLEKTGPMQFLTKNSSADYALFSSVSSGRYPGCLKEAICRYANVLPRKGFRKLYPIQKSGLKNKYKAGEMARWKKHFPGKSEDVSSNPSMVGCACTPGVLQQNGA